VIPKAVCLHEEDAGMLWKHTDTRLGHVEVRRNRRLVISMVSTFANYVSGREGGGRSSCLFCSCCASLCWLLCGRRICLRVLVVCCSMYKGA
jgi:hypothetical protein